MTRPTRPLLAALALALLAGSAVAQAPPPGARPTPPTPSAIGEASPPASSPSASSPSASSSRAEGPGLPPRMPMSMGGRAAHLRFEHGNVDIDVKCAEDEATKACVDAIMPLVERLGQMPGGFNESPRYR